LGNVYVGDEPGVEPRDETLGHARELLRILVARDDDGLVRVPERIEGMKELFLRLLAPGEELNVIEEQQVAPVAVPRAELVHLVVLKGFDELVREAFGRDVDDACVRLLLEDTMRDRVHQVGLAEACSTAQKERIVPRAPFSGRSTRSGVGELVGRSDDEV